MRGLFFAKPLEYRLEVPGDTFVQGAPLRGTLSVTNRGGKPSGKIGLHLGLAYGDFKALKAEGAKALQILEQQTLADGFTLKPEEEKRCEWELPMSLTSPIQSKEGGPFLLYGGDLKVSESRGQIDLPMQMAPSFLAFFTTIENHFAFEMRAHRCMDGMLEAQFKPPASYPALDELLVQLTLDAKSVQAEFHARGRGLKPGEPGKLATKNRAAKKAVPLEQFLPRSGIPNRALYRTLVTELLPQIATRVERKP